MYNEEGSKRARNVNFRDLSAQLIKSGDDSVIAVDISQDVMADTVADILPASLPAEIIDEIDDTDNVDSKKLTLAYECLYEVPRTIVERFSNYVMYLDISHNKITNLDPLVHFKHLTSLIADDNPITENTSLPPLPKLQLLWLNHCKVSALYPWVGGLRESCGALRHLSLMGNPAAPSYLNGGTFYEYLQYRLFVISQFPSLAHLDDRTVTEDQRHEAQRLYKRPLFERLVRPGTGLSMLVNSSVSWTDIHSKFGALWGGKEAEERGRRNFVI